uniref:ORF19 n=1 Tax=Chlamydomonas reinhardtii TaxID=3055 RepID=Q99202_CHLRE|nr:unnamed protein product [Chlamydomonas reinhardtii]
LLSRCQAPCMYLWTRQAGLCRSVGRLYGTASVSRYGLMLTVVTRLACCAARSLPILQDMYAYMLLRQSHSRGSVFCQCLMNPETQANVRISSATHVNANCMCRLPTREWTPREPTLVPFSPGLTSPGGAITYHRSARSSVLYVITIKSVWRHRLTCG